MQLKEKIELVTNPGARPRAVSVGPQNKKRLSEIILVVIFLLHGSLHPTFFEFTGHMDGGRRFSCAFKAIPEY